MSYSYDYLVFIGRFQPFHLAHDETVRIAIRMAQRVILCLGSAQAERTLKNPFLAEERRTMILSNFNIDEQQRLLFTDIIDVYNDVKWQNLVRQQVGIIIKHHDKVGLIGHDKDESSYYLDLFPEWQREPLDSLYDAISATPIRESYYQGIINSELLPQGTIQFLQDFQHTDMFKTLQQQYQQSR